jgi:hypothetical protein
MKNALNQFDVKIYKRVKMIRDKSFMIEKTIRSSFFIFSCQTNSKIRNSVYRLMPDKLLSNDTFKTLKVW